MLNIAIYLFVVVILVTIYRPSLEVTKEGKYLLFYGRKVRKYRILN